MNYTEGPDFTPERVSCIQKDVNCRHISANQTVSLSSASYACTIHSINWWISLKVYEQLDYFSFLKLTRAAKTVRSLKEEIYILLPKGL